MIEIYQKFHEAYMYHMVKISKLVQVTLLILEQKQKSLCWVFFGVTDTIKICVSELAFSNAIYIDDDIVYIAIFSISECVSRWWYWVIWRHKRCMHLTYLEYNECNNHHRGNLTMFVCILQIQNRRKKMIGKPLQ